MLQNVKTLDVTYSENEEFTKSKSAPNKSSKLKKLLWFFTSFILFCILGLLSGVILYKTYIYFSNTRTILKIVEIDTPTESKEQIEAENLNNTKKDPISLTDLKVLALDSGSKAEADKLNLSAEIEKSENIVIKDDGVINTIDKNVITIYLTFKPQVESQSLNKDQFLSNIDILTKNSTIQKIHLDTSFLTTNYNEIITSLSDLLKSRNIQLSVQLPTKWGDFVDYSDYKNFDPSYKVDLALNLVAIYADEIHIEGFGYTTPNSILPGPIAPDEWYEKVLQYYISKDLPREKIFISVNTKAYIWEKREIALKNPDNYILTEKQIIDLKIKSEFEEITPIQAIDNENFVELDKKIIVFPKSEKIEKAVKLIAEYGLGGVVFY